MRLGKNPAKLRDNNKVENKAFHQIIIPVFLPELKGYYREGLEILKLCIESIYLTTHNKTFISVVNNGSCQEVRTYLDQCLKNKKIHEVIHTSAIGKINAIAKGLSGHNFDLITLTDADILFKNGWQKGVYDIYKAFPKAGMVGSSTNPLGENYLTENIFFENALNRNITSESPDNYEDVKLGYTSVRREINDIENIKLKTILSNNVKAVIGSGHSCSTYRRECLKSFYNFKPSKYKMGGHVMKKYIDFPVNELGLWRLTTFKNYTYHLGNVKENWMIDKFKKIEMENSVPYLFLNKMPSKQPKLLIKLKSAFARKFIIQKNVQK